MASFTNVNYDAVDAAIIASIRAGRPTFGMMTVNPELSAACKAIVTRDWDRVIDRRLQALKRKGVIRYTSGVWVIL